MEDRRHRVSQTSRPGVRGGGALARPRPACGCSGQPVGPHLPRPLDSSTASALASSSQPPNSHFHRDDGLLCHPALPIPRCGRGATGTTSLTSRGLHGCLRKAVRFGTSGPRQVGGLLLLSGTVAQPPRPGPRRSPGTCSGSGADLGSCFSAMSFWIQLQDTKEGQGFPGSRQVWAEGSTGARPRLPLWHFERNRNI